MKSIVGFCFAAVLFSNVSLAGGAGVPNDSEYHYVNCRLDDSIGGRVSLSFPLNTGFPAANPEYIEGKVSRAKKFFSNSKSFVGVVDGASVFEIDVNAKTRFLPKLISKNNETYSIEIDGTLYGETVSTQANCDYNKVENL